MIRPMSSNPSPSPSLGRTGLRAGTAFAGAVFKSALLAILLGGGVFFFYISQLSGPGMPAARAGGAGAVIALLFSPSVLVALLLLGFMPLYLMLGIAQGRSRALRQVVLAHGDTIAQRLGAAIAGRVEAMPRTHGALQRTSEWLSVDALGRQLAPVLGEGRAVRAVIGFVLNRLPMSTLLADWQAERAAHGGTEAGVENPALRALLQQRIGETLQEMATPSRTPLYIALAAHALLLGFGLWLVA